MFHPLKALLNFWHRQISRSPKIISSNYIEFLSFISRNLVPDEFGERIRNSICGHSIDWKKLDPHPKSVYFENGISFLIYPHIGEFDEWALFSRRLRYENCVFTWLSQQVLDEYDVVIEIGANVGVYTLFLDALVKSNPSKRLKEIFAFEPSLEAFRRLIRNLAINNAEVARPFNVAVGEAMGFVPFFEPLGHLTNGSFVEDFASTFSDKIDNHPVVSLNAAELSKLIIGKPKLLLKIDVEGYEPKLLESLTGIIKDHKPDILLEILDDTVSFVNNSKLLERYRKFLINDVGLVEYDNVHADPVYRDWILFST